MTTTVISLLFGLAAMAAMVVAWRSISSGVALALDLLERSRAAPPARAQDYLPSGAGSSDPGPGGSAALAVAGAAVRSRLIRA